MLRGSGEVPAEVGGTCVEGTGEGDEAGCGCCVSMVRNMGFVVLVGGGGKPSAAACFASRSWVKYFSCCCC